jgi:hypothetical protein
MRCKTKQRKGSRSALSSGIVASRGCGDGENRRCGSGHSSRVSGTGEMNDRRGSEFSQGRTEFGLSPSNMKGAFGNEGALRIFGFPTFSKHSARLRAPLGECWRRVNSL